MPDAKFASLGDQKYLSLETFKKSGEGVQTPVWFVLHEGALYVYTEATSWKVKRIRTNPQVRVAACSMRGVIKGPWIPATASFVEGAEQRAAYTLLDRKYWVKRILNLLTRLNRHERAMIKIVSA